MARHPDTFNDEDFITGTLDALAAERGKYDSNRTSELADEVIRRFGEGDLAERLYAAIPRERPWRDVTDLFDLLAWHTGDNGAELNRTMEKWLLDATDIRRVQIALNGDSVPFSSPASEPGMMERVLGDLATNFPEVSERCHELVDLVQRLDRSRP